MAPACASVKLVGGIVVPGIPDWMMRMMSVSPVARRKRPRCSSMPGTISPFGPWQPAQLD